MMMRMLVTQETKRSQSWSNIVVFCRTVYQL